MVTKKKSAKVVDISTAIEETKKAIKKAKTTSKEKFPKVVEGSHLTVYTYEDGSTKLVWDDEQLSKDVREALASVEQPKKVSKKKK